MKTYLLKYLLMPGLILLMMACSKEFLETPNNATLSVENFYKTKDDLDKAITAAYSVFKAADLNDGNIVGETFCHGHFLIGNANSDDAEVGGGIGEAVDLILMSECNSQADLGLASSIWTGLYQGIYRCNLVIENTPNALEEVSIEQKAKYIAEAKFIRSYCFFHLLRVFGPVPLITEPLGSEDFYSVSRNPVSEIYHQIEFDLQEAAENLPWAAQFDGHANRGSAYGLLAKVLLFESSYARNYPGDERFNGLEQKWDEAYAAANAVINSGYYDLSVDFGDIFHQEGEYSKESVFEIAFMTEGDAYHARNNGNTFAVYYRSRSMGGWGFDLPSQELVDAFENGSKSYETGEWVSTGNPSDSSLWQDPRMDWTIVFDGEPAWFEPTETMSNGEGLTQYFTGYCSQKILTPEISLPGNFSNFPNNLRLLRYADVILIAAEAAFFNNDEATAIQLVNNVRERARREASNPDALPPVPGSVTGNNLLSVIKHERRIELAMEGHRYWDLIRWGDAKEELRKYYANNTLHNIEDPYTVGINEFQPIPLTEIRNSKGALEQNNGY
jgi:starch-binding outer membrane protein, SusD/RagB family